MDWIELKLRPNASVFLNIILPGYEIFAIQDFWSESPQRVEFYDTEFATDIYLTKEIRQRSNELCAEEVNSIDYTGKSY